MGFKSLVLVGALAFCFVGCSSSEKTEAPATDCVCETAKTENGWCDKCSVGYVGGNKMECHACVDKNMETADAGPCDACAAK